MDLDNYLNWGELDYFAICFMVFRSSLDLDSFKILWVDGFFFNPGWMELQSKSRNKKPKLHFAKPLFPSLFYLLFHSIQSQKSVHFEGRTLVLCLKYLD
jgi:hypothetical protein